MPRPWRANACAATASCAELRCGGVDAAQLHGQAKSRSASARSARNRLGCQPTATPPAPAGPPSGSLGSPGRSALAAYRRRRSEELVAWTRSLTWRAPLVAAAGLTGQVLASQAGLPRAGLGGLAAAALVGWRLRFRPSEQARSWSAGRPRRWDGC
jgi:hypothetical protein